MDSLRWILLGLGVVVIAGIYIYAQIAKQRRREPEPGYEQVDWEQDSVQGLSDADDYDDLPSMDALHSARATHRAEGNSVAAVAPDFEDTQEIPAPEVLTADVEEECEAEEESPAQISPGLRNNLLLGSQPIDPVMGTPISPTELEAERPSPSMNADSLTATDSKRAEPNFTDLLNFDTGEVAAALQRRRDPSSAAPAPTTKSPVQNTFSFAEAKDAQLEQAAKPAPKPIVKPKPEPQPEPAEQKEVVVLHVKATDSIGFYGPEMAQCFADIGIKFGDMDIYHYQSGGQRLLSVANMVVPGTFDPDNFTGFTTPGISLFLQLRPSSDFDLCEQVLVKSAQYIAYKLKGEVLTANHEALDNVKQAALSRDIADIKAAFA